MLRWISSDLVSGHQSTVEDEWICDAQAGRCAASRHLEGARDGLSCLSILQDRRKMFGFKDNGSHDSCKVIPDWLRRSATMHSKATVVACTVAQSFVLCR